MTEEEMKSQAEGRSHYDGVKLMKLIHPRREMRIFRIVERTERRSYFA